MSGWSWRAKMKPSSQSTRPHLDICFTAALTVLRSLDHMSTWVCNKIQISKTSAAHSYSTPKWPSLPYGWNPQIKGYCLTELQSGILNLEQLLTKTHFFVLLCRVFVTLSFEESVSQVSRPHKLFSPGRYPNLWGPVLPRHQETPAGLLHLWYKTNHMQNADMVDWWLKKQKKTKKSHSHFLRSAPVPLGRCGPRVNGSVHDLWLHARWEQSAENPQGSAACGRCLSSDPILSPAGGWYTGPTYRHQNVLFTNCLEIIDKILGMCNEACETRAGVACTFLNNVQKPLVVVT